MSTDHKPDRRRALAGAACALALVSTQRARAQRKPVVAALFAGSVEDGGFMQSGYEGLLAARDRTGVSVSFRQGVAPRPETLREALRALATESPDLVVAHGGQNNEAAAAVAAEFPGIRFIVTQGNVRGANLASYEVLQEQSTFLAGALAGLVTKTGVVGHMSGIRVVPGLKGRAAYAAGVRLTNPGARLLTNFSGNQDDNPLSKRIALAMIDAKADVIFTMLNAGRQGAIEATRERGVAQIGNVVDWVARMPDVFIASAMANAGNAVLAGVEDFVAGTFEPGTIKKVGLERPDAVRLSMRATLDAAVRDRLAALAGDIAAGRIEVPVTWSGEEFAP